MSLLYLFYTFFPLFLQIAKEDCEDFDKKIKDIRDLTAEFAEYFCEEPKKFVVEDYLKCFKQFCDSLKKAEEVCDPS